jgi:hypothetical protein
MKAEMRKAETQKLRNGTANGGRLAVFLSGFPDFLIHHFPAQTRKPKKFFSEFLGFGLAPFGFRI